MESFYLPNEQIADYFYVFMFTSFFVSSKFSFQVSFK